MSSSASSTPSPTKANAVEVQLQFKPGQKKPTPPPADATRVFYESLYTQNPDSEMAARWCIEFGVLDASELPVAEKRVQRLERRRA